MVAFDQCKTNSGVLIIIHEAMSIFSFFFKLDFIKQDINSSPKKILRCIQCWALL